jgi:hypothetical protein
MEACLKEFVRPTASLPGSPSSIHSILSMAQLRYKKLPANSQAIRLLVLQPSLNFFAPIECTIRTTSIDPKARQDQSPYKALSYAWKDKAYLDSPSDEEPGTLPITCDGQTIIVSANLFLALRRLRQRLSPSCVWVDYLCINQADLEERSEQVSMMGNIFSCSDEVVVWLGESSHALEHVRYDWTGDGKDSIQIEEYRECFERWDNDLGPRVCDDADDEPRWAFGRRRAFGPPEAFGPRRAFDGLEDFKARMYRPDLATGVFGVFCLLSSLAQDGTISRMRFYESANFTAGQVKWSKLIKDALWALTERPWVRGQPCPSVMMGSSFADTDRVVEKNLGCAGVRACQESCHILRRHDGAVGHVRIRS